MFIWLNRSKRYSQCYKELTIFLYIFNKKESCINEKKTIDKDDGDKASIHQVSKCNWQFWIVFSSLSIYFNLVLIITVVQCIGALNSKEIANTLDSVCGFIVHFSSFCDVHIFTDILIYRRSLQCFVQLITLFLSFFFPNIYIYLFKITSKH